MPSDDYASAVGGGLKLKGVKDSGVKKKKKKKKASKGDPSKSGEQASALQKALAGEDEDAGRQGGGKEGEDLSEDELRTLDHRGNDGKTAAERAHEEMRRRRLQDRLQKEGVKTHKQRVEELNKYLSNLSEHHDMPRIGPG